MTVPKERINEIIDTLQGSCKSIDDVATEEEREDFEVSNAINEAIAECDCCGWWVEAGEIDEDGNCDSCHTDPKDDEDD